MSGACALVVSTDDVAQQAVGVAAAAATRHVGVFRRPVLVVIFARRVLFKVSAVGVAATCHPDIWHGARSVLAKDGVAGVGRDALSRMHSPRVTAGEVLGEVFACQDRAGIVTNATGCDAVVLGVDSVDTP